MQIRSALNIVLITLILFLCWTCKKDLFRNDSEVFTVNSFISSIKCYDENAIYSNYSIPYDTSSVLKPVVSVQSWVIKGKDLLMSVTVPVNTSQLYFAACNPEAEYGGLEFDSPQPLATSGYFTLNINYLTKADTISPELINYMVVMSSSEDIQLDHFELLVSCKTKDGFSDTTSVPVSVTSIPPYQKELILGFKPIEGYSYTITIGLPGGGNIVYSSNLAIGSATFDNSQSIASTMNYDSGLDVVWIHLDPQFGHYTMNATINIDLSQGSQYIYVYFFVIAEGKIDQLNLDANVIQTGEYSAVGLVDFGFSYFEEYKYIVFIEPIMKDGYARLPRFVNQGIHITIFPSPMPPEEFISLTLITDPGTFGAAVFDNGLQEMQINSSQIINIIGKQTSSEKDNITLAASFEGTILASQKFAVRTWPLKFQQSEGYNDNGVLYFKYTYESESGNVDDLKSILIGEIVEYSGDGQITNYDGKMIFRPFSPPYNGDFVEHPIIENFNIENNILFDRHGYIVAFDVELAFKKPYQSNVIIGTQYYRFRDPVLMYPDQYINLSGPHYIRRNVYEDPPGLGIWHYQIEKDGVIGNRILPL